MQGRNPGISDRLQAAGRAAGDAWVAAVLQRDSVCLAPKRTANPRLLGAGGEKKLCNSKLLCAEKAKMWEMVFRKVHPQQQWTPVA